MGDFYHSKFLVPLPAAPVPGKTSRFNDHLARFRAALGFRLKYWFKKSHPAAGGVTFCIAHFNSPEILNVTLHALRRFYPGSRVIVADAVSQWSQCRLAGEICAHYQAEWHPLAANHRHTGLLNYMFRQVVTPTAIFLDQDCVLLDSLDELIKALDHGKLLIGPSDEMRMTHPNLCRAYPEVTNKLLRVHAQYIHASIMLLHVPAIRGWSRFHPFTWNQKLGPQVGERYYGITQLIRARRAEAILALDNGHSAYGMGTVYFHAGRPLAYHNWYSGQIYGKHQKMDKLCDADWLRTEMARFIHDYWAGTLNLDLPGIPTLTTKPPA